MLVLVENMGKKLELITKWLRCSGLVVNEKKPELCLFHKNDQDQITIKLENSLIESKNQYMLTLESLRFQVLGEVSFCTRTLPNYKKMEQGVTITPVYPYFD